MEKAPASPIKIKQEPVDQEPAAENLRNIEDNLNGTIELSDDDDFDPMIANYTAPADAQDEDGIALHPDEGDLAIELDYEPTENDRGESILDEVTKTLTNSFLDIRRPFRMTRATELKWFHTQRSKTIDCDLDQLIFILFNYAIYCIYTSFSKPVRAVDSLYVYIIF